MRQFTTRLLTVISIWLIASATPIAIAQKPAEEEYLLKVGFIYNFAKLTRWPENTWLGDDASLVLCTAGDDALVSALEWLGGKTVKGHSVAIQPLEWMQIPRNCHVLYVAVSEQERYADIVTTLQAEPILSISEIQGFANSGGVIELVREQGRIRFKINLDAARGAGLELSSRLLSLALVIIQETAP